MGKVHKLNDSVLYSIVTGPLYSTAFTVPVNRKITEFLDQLSICQLISMELSRNIIRKYVTKRTLRVLPV
jgi:hypothetical protein